MMQERRPLNGASSTCSAKTHPSWMQGLAISSLFNLDDFEDCLAAEIKDMSPDAADGSGAWQRSRLVALRRRFYPEGQT